MQEKLGIKCVWENDYIGTLIIYILIFLFDVINYVG